ncbi:class I SAM-dependent methyltransferase [Loktanella sp. S4079]|uniref:class I SAM-dependent methyltransferase n=1 Tax=Loktanella sp. S4079 TaxID=579483 RepID=UPI0005F9D7C6|nr:class I SAM-dependent methyltransferase [Loktanella sp. S4079]KJZ19102.1 methyltransferase [Loktanella sp. S4079]
MSSAAQQIISLYRRHAAAWVRARSTSLMEKHWLDRFVDPLPAGARLLDIGCGAGDPIARYLMGRGFALTGVDSSPELIAIAQEKMPAARWSVADMRELQLDQQFDGMLAWDSMFHLTPDDQRLMFPIFAAHANLGARLMFTSGPAYGDAIGEFEGEPLYHSSLDPSEYRLLLDQNGFEVVDHIVEDPDCGFRTVWLARFVRASRSGAI